MAGETSATSRQGSKDRYGEAALSAGYQFGYNPAKQRRVMTNKYVEKHDQVWRIKDARVALDSVIYQFRQGRSPEAIQAAFPALSLSQIYGAIAFYLDHESEIDEYLAYNESTEEEFSREIARLFPRGAALKARLKQRLPEPTK